ncbi:MAG: DUF2905 domain-containing protein [Chromatiales bacterium]|nr:DUF2905 domain-containing protein [Chromatiales bacterium]MDH4029859.1 DUF2905 domain-containing protein [Chromatiales bacterium]
MMGRVLILIGLILVFAGMAVSWAPWLFSWFGRLPGDIRIERESGTVLIPLASMAILSLLLTVVLNLLFRR